MKVPTGVEDGSQIRLGGEGEAGIWGGTAGNLYITLSVQEHEFFRRDGNNILYELPIDFAQAALGDEMEVPTIRGKASLKITSGTQSGQVFRLKGKGIPYLHHPGKGDQLVKVIVVTPERLDEEQRRLFFELAKSLGKGKTSEQERKRFFNRIRLGKT